MFCIKCGAQNREDALFCDKCGTPLNNNQNILQQQNQLQAVQQEQTQPLIQQSQSQIQQPITSEENIQNINADIKNNKASTKSDKKIAIVVIVSILAIILFVGIPLYNHELQERARIKKMLEVKDNTPNEKEDNKTKDTPIEETPANKLYNEIDKLYKEKLAFSAGNYIKGDIPSGEYAFIKYNGSGSYYSEKDGAGEIIDNENFDSFGYVKVHEMGNLETRGLLINVTAFDKLGVKGAKEIYEKLNNQQEWKQAGYYKVGTDIEPGSYIVESIGNGYWSIMTGPVGNSDIVDNDNYNGKATINLVSGQYLNLSRSTITKQ